MLVYITRSDGGTCDQANDYSYNGSASALMVTDHITVYYEGALIDSGGGGAHSTGTVTAACRSRGPRSDREPGRSP